MLSSAPTPHATEWAISSKPNPPDITPQILRFGVFEVDVAAGEVCKFGIRQKLAGQPFKVLRALLERPGEIVTRDELRQRIWPDNTFVDYDLALRKAINRLREVLGDSSENPRFIETLPRRGYRFLLPVIEGNGERPLPIPVVAPREVSTVVPRGLVATAGFAIPLLLLAGIAAIVLGAIDRKPPLRLGQFVRITNDGRDKSGNLSDGISSPILTDGTRLFFVEKNIGPSELMQVSAAGGDTLPITSPFRNVRLAGISPDSTQLLIGGTASPTAVEQPFYALPAIGGSAVRLSDFLAHDASWSPNGRSIAYATADALMVANTGGSDARKVVSGLGAVSWPRWSPDATRLRFTVTDQQSKENSIWEVYPDGTRLRQISRDLGLEGDKCCGSWTPDGAYFIFQSSLWSGTSLWVLPEATLLRRHPRPVQLSSGPVWASAPSISTDGKKLFFIGVQPRTETIRYNRRDKQFVPFLPGISADTLDVSKDGNWITFTQYPEASLWLARSDGSERIRLTPENFYAFRPRWSPDGKNIIYFGPRLHHAWKLYLLPRTGGTPTQLIPDTGSEGDPTWSPDGGRVAFGRLPWMISASEQPRLYIWDLNSKQAIALPGSDGLFSPRWSPSGRYIVAMTADSSKLMLYDFEARSWRVLANGSFGSPEWSKEDAVLYALDALTDCLILIRTATGKIELVADLKQERIASTTTGVWTGLAPDGSILTIRDLSTQEIFSADLTR